LEASNILAGTKKALHLCKALISLVFLAPRPGLEPGTYGLTGYRSICSLKGLRFQYFLSVSPQEGLGRRDLNPWILEVQKQQRPLVFMQDDLPSMRAILRVSAPSREGQIRP
jgi:hypothetical protein